MKDIRTLSELHGWKDNPRNISPKDFERLKGQIKKLGQYKPLLITKDGEVIGGNMRLKAYNDLGIKEVWVSVVEPKDDNEKLEYALSDNDRAGYYDDDMLANLIPNYDIDWSQYAVDMKPPEDIQALIDRIAPVEEDEAPEVAEGEAVSNLGEIYQLGRHRLMCGDSTKIEDVEKLMDGKKADMVFTDPPYGMDLDTDYSKMPGTKTKYSKVIGDDKEFDISFIFSLLPSPIYYIWGAEYLYNTIPNFKQGSMIVWAKRQSEAENKVFGSAYELCWVFPKIKKEIWFVRAINQSSERLGVHPTQKPVELGVRAIKDRTEEENIIVDLFGGSGSTLIACEQTKRICYCSEIDNKYIDVIIKRWMKFTGKRAYKIIDADGKPCNIPVKFADESFMDGKTSQESMEAKLEG